MRIHVSRNLRMLRMATHTRTPMFDLGTTNIHNSDQTRCQAAFATTSSCNNTLVTSFIQATVHSRSFVRWITIELNLIIAHALPEAFGKLLTVCRRQTCAGFKRNSQDHMDAELGIVRSDHRKTVRDEPKTSAAMQSAGCRCGIDFDILRDA